MSGQKPYTHYTLADIDRYLKGELSAADMHALEKAALQDPFLADAIEGYEEAGVITAKSDLEAIRNRILLQQPAAKVLPLKPDMRWWRAAAVILLVAGAGSISWLLLRTDNNGKEQTLAKTTVIVPPSTQKPPPETVSQDKSITARNPAVIPPKNKEPLVAAETATARDMAESNNPPQRDVLASLNPVLSDPKPSLQSLGGKTVLADSVATTTLQNQLATQALAGKVAGVSVNPPANKAKGFVRNKENASLPQQTVLHYFKGRVTDSAGVALGNALIRFDSKAMVADNKGYFDFMSPDSTPDIQVAAVGFETKKIQLSPEKTNDIILGPTTQSLQEVVVSGYSAKRKKGMTGSVQLPSPAKSPTLSPETGWPSFTTTLSDKLAAGRARTLSGGISGTIELELDLDRKGRVKNVSVVRTFNETLNTTLIQAVKDGPTWLQPDGKPATGRQRVSIIL